eukprot:Mrub_02503.p1 GENE.Mrub_02503~~Mrub_02503.p1  ORF type:complete len:542 (+),score=101.56 Mrub_02503:104-1627(+)
MIIEPYCKLKPDSFKEITYYFNRKNQSNENNNYKNKFSKSPDSNKNNYLSKPKNKQYNPPYKDNMSIYNNYMHNMHADTSLYSMSNTNMTNDSIYSRNTMNDSNYSINNSNQNNYENSKSHLKALVTYITNAIKDTNESILLDSSTQINEYSNHEQENHKAMGILKGCRQMKQIRVAFDVYNQMRREGIRISSNVYNELLHCCIKCNELKRACYVIRKMDKVDMFPDYDLIDGFLELYNRKCILDREDLENNKLRGENVNGNINGVEENDYVIKDFNPVNKTNIWLDQSLDKYYKIFKDDANDQYELDKKEYDEYIKRTNQNRHQNTNREKPDLKLPQEVYNITEELLKDDEMYKEFFSKNKNTAYNSLNTPIQNNLNKNYKDSMHEFNKNLMNDYQTFHHNVFRLNEVNDNLNVSGMISGIDNVSEVNKVDISNIKSESSKDDNKKGLETDRSSLNDSKSINKDKVKFKKVTRMQNHEEQSCEKNNYKNQDINYSKTEIITNDKSK